jgi:hypothetical protein
MDLTLSTIILQFGVEKFDSLSKIKYKLSGTYYGFFLDLLSWRLYTIPISKQQPKKHSWNHKNERPWKIQKRTTLWNSKNQSSHQWHWKSKSSNSQNQWHWKKKSPNSRINWNSKSPNSQNQWHWKKKQKKWRIKAKNNETQNKPLTHESQSQSQSETPTQIQSQSETPTKNQSQLQTQTQIQSQLRTQTQDTQLPPQQTSIDVDLRWKKRKPVIMAENLLQTTCK